MKFPRPANLKKNLTPRRRPGNWLIILLFLLTLAFPLRPVHAQMVVSDVANTVVNTAKYVWDKVSSLASKLWQNAGSIAYQRALSTALNKIAYDTATYIGSGHAGQKPLFVTEGWGKYLADTGDAAAGQFVESFVNNMNNPATDCSSALTTCQNNCNTAKNQYFTAAQNSAPNPSADAKAELSYTGCMSDCAKNNTACAAKNTQVTASALQATPSFNVCSPSSLAAKIQIGLGLVNVNQPQAPDCTASQMIKNWQTDINQELADLHNPNYMQTFVGLFNPSSNDLGIYVQAKSDLSSQAQTSVSTAQLGLSANQGWLNVTDIAGNTAAPPGTAARQLQVAQDVQAGNLGKITGDVFVDAANIFLNQLAMSAFNRLVKSLGQSGNNNGAVGSANGYTNDYTSGQGVTALEQQTTKLLNPNFGTQADYDILSSLGVCPDPTNPGPDNCVIDSQFLQAISERKTVADAVSGGYLHGDWQFTKDQSGGAYNSSYSLRDIEILIKYRILPVGWEQAAIRANDPSDPVKATLNDLLSCFGGSYNNFDPNFDKSRCSIFQGLVDPNWVLKAPLNYCQKSGYGNQIMNTTVIPGVAGMPSTLSISRADSYCADGQTCIKEKTDGSCQAYGYCNGEKRTWHFNTDTCDPVYNTCQSFSSPQGQVVSYLENTLNYGNCNADNAGCLQYALSGVYSSSTGAVAWNSTPAIYLNKNLGACTSADEGCTTLIRNKPTWGTNLVMDSDFENDNVGDTSSGGQLNGWAITGNGTIVDASQEPGGMTGKALKLTNTVAPAVTGSNSSHSLLPDNLQIIPGQAYTLSADVYLEQGASVSLILGSASDGYLSSTSVLNGWQHLTVTRPADTSYNDPVFSISGDPGNNRAGAQVVFYLKNLKFEMSNWDTGYSSYGGLNIIHEKLLPNYLANACYVNPTAASPDYTLKPDAPSVCGSYARLCNQSEVGCDLYTKTEDNFSVAAKATNSDYCPAACLGYDVYITQASHFHSPAKESLIPSTARTCSAAAAGCTEFTNLDAVASGGEQKEYYTQLKQCIKPDQNKCANFYAWAGQGNGYQLQTYSLEKDGSGLPLVTLDSNGQDDSALCNATIYNLPVSDPNFNPDCQQFYNAAGQVSYHLASRTITCSDNCHAYRMTGLNVDATITAASACTGGDKHWDASTNSCDTCPSGGLWDNTAGACVYQAIPGEGQTCQASDNGCREYNGNSGSNVRLAASYGFENSLEGWASNCSNGAGVSLSSVANNNNGHSLQYSANTCSNMTAAVNIGGLINSGSAYTLKFLARADSGANLQFNFVNTDTGATASFNPVAVSAGGGWNIYETDLTDVGATVGTSTNQFLVVSSNNNFYLDDVILSEITDRYYLIDGSSQIPDACNYDNLGNYQGPDYNLGCAQYVDSSGLKNNLRRFSGLCSDSSVGCEQMINTENYSPTGPGYWEDGVATSTCNTASDPKCVSVPGDRAIYAVYDAAKQCGAASQGCSRLGQGQGGANLTGWADVYELNNPDNYNKILCNSASVGCQAWGSTTDNSVSYFKDPGSAACVYRTPQGASANSRKGWYKIPAKRCDLNGDGKISGTEVGTSICFSDSDCGPGKCITDNNDYLCSVTTDPGNIIKTVGLGGAGNAVPTPNSDAGVCDASSASCTEYIDPVSSFNPNLVANPSFTPSCDQNGNNCIQDGWYKAATGQWSSPLQPNQQVITLDQNKLYSLSVTGDNSGVSLFATSSSFLQLLENNNFVDATQNISALPAGQELIFDSLNNSQALLTGGANGLTITIRELAINYQLASSLDKSSCSGQAQTSNGCVLFNERSVNGAAGLATLSWDAANAESGNSNTPVSPQSCSSTGGSCTANQVVKVSPDRVCSQWLSCTTYMQDPVTKQKTCYAYGECDRLDSKGECSHFAVTGGSASTLQATDSPNATGYSMLGYYNLDQMAATGTLLTVPNGDFEGTSTIPVCGTSVSGHCLVNGPDSAVGATDYPAQGAAYLVVPGGSPYTFPAISINYTKFANYFISYLVSTKNSSGFGATVTIKDSSGNTLYTFSSPSDIGWTREVNKFSLVNVKNISITLSSQGTSAKVYFDDVSITPVLQTGADSYAAPECRLYPTGDSLACLNTSTANTIKPGWEGYCLEHDPANPGVCLLWYPVDSIPVTGFSTEGYNGKFPLDYCTNVNANFDLVEKREIYAPKGIDVDTSGYCDVTNRYTWYPGHTSPGSARGYYFIDGSQTFSGTTVSCNSSDYEGFGYESDCKTGSHGDDSCCHAYFCIPKVDNSSLNVLATKYDNNNQDTNGPATTLITNANNAANLLPDAYPGDPVSSGHTALNQNPDNWVTITAYYSGSQGNYNASGWYKYDGLTSQEQNNNNPPIAVYNWDHKPTSESQLVYPYATSTDTQVYHLACNQMVEAVTPSDNNWVWAQRMNDIATYPDNTPEFFKYPYDSLGGYGLQYYGQNRQDAPFGGAQDGAQTNSNFYDGNSTLRDASGQNPPFAGRPYGCTNGTGPDSGAGCNMIGYCSGDHNVYCLASSSVMINSSTNLSAKTCGSYGTCQPLWSATDPMTNNNIPSSSYTSDPPYKNILKNIFLHGEVKNSKDGVTIFDYLSSIPRCNSNIRPAVTDPNSFCKVLPVVSHIHLYYGDSKLEFGRSSIRQTGLYRLEFNTAVDPEQQPLRQLDINWGDGHSQTITNQDDRPNPASPYVFYHWYNAQTVTIPIITATDNWGVYCTQGSPNNCYQP